MKRTDTEKAHILARRAAHFAALEALTLPDAKGRKPSGLSTWRKLRAVENDAHDAATAQCNGEPYGGQPFRHEDDDAPEDEYSRFLDSIRARVVKILQRHDLPPGFFINQDPRGYALKIRTPRSDPHRTPDEVTDCPGLETDWGGYGILAATIE
jgi:hypothetical protein